MNDEPPSHRWLLQLCIASNTVFGCYYVWHGDLWGLFNFAVAWICIYAYRETYIKGRT